jgi:hypothetical protein
VVCVVALLVIAAGRWVLVLRGVIPVRPEDLVAKEQEAIRAPAGSIEEHIQESSGELGD